MEDEGGAKGHAASEQKQKERHPWRKSPAREAAEKEKEANVERAQREGGGHMQERPTQHMQHTDVDA